MQANRRRDTAPEWAVRRRLHARGLRYRVDFRVAPPLHVRPDIVFTKARVAIFIDGCFWHGCPLHGTSPKRNAQYWGPKIEGNAARDERDTFRLEQLGWLVLRFWEHEDPQTVAERIETAVSVCRTKLARQHLRTERVDQSAD